VISATNRDLAGMVARGAFRRDLFHRLNIIGVTIPPLRERRGDIRLLAEHFLAQYRCRYDKPGLGASESFYAALEQRPFPGNARELENLVHRAVIVCRDADLDAGHLPPDAGKPRPAVGADLPFHTAKARAIERFERHYLLEVLVRCRGVISRAARDCGLSERNFHQKLKTYGISAKGIG
jgi:DNA-binding NtrC family response regulator